MEPFDAGPRGDETVLRRVSCQRSKPATSRMNRPLRGGQALFPAVAVRLHKTILQEAAELRQLADQAEEAKEAAAAAERELRLLGTIRIQDLEQLREVGRVRSELEAKARAARLLMNETAAARVELDHLEAWAGRIRRPEAKFPRLCDG